MALLQQEGLGGDAPGGGCSAPQHCPCLALGWIHPIPPGTGSGGHGSFWEGS